MGEIVEEGYWVPEQYVPSTWELLGDSLREGLGVEWEEVGRERVGEKVDDEGKVLANHYKIHEQLPKWGATRTRVVEQLTAHGINQVMRRVFSGEVIQQQLAGTSVMGRMRG